MPQKKLVSFSVDYLQILNEKGIIDKKLDPKLSKKDVLALYKTMVLTRKFDDKAIKLQRQGRMGTYGPLLGQEASQIGPAFALKKEDWLFPTYREMGCYIARGNALKNLYLYWMGFEDGMKIQEDINDFTLCITIGSQAVHAVGAAMAASIQKKKQAVLVYFGDGGSSEGEVHEAMNFAGVFKAPVVFICCNNQWAISLPRKKQTAAETLAQRAIGYGFEGIQVDGNDVLAMYAVTKKALDKARAGKGPTLIEAYTYRMEMHTTADDPTRYRSKKEVAFWKLRDPVDRMRKYLEKKKLWNKKQEEQLTKEVEAQVIKAVEEAEKYPAPKAEEMFKYVYKDIPVELQQQMRDANAKNQ